jgi:SOS-response transcriptional repressor LexA
VPEPLTDRERAVLDWIVAYHHGRRCLPTFREIGAAFDVATPCGVRSYLLALERKGWLELTGRSRAMQILAVHGKEGPPEPVIHLLSLFWRL